MKQCEVRDCGQEAKKILEFEDTAERLFVCLNCHKVMPVKIVNEYQFNKD